MKHAIWVWNNLTADADVNLTPLGVVALSHGARTALRRSEEKAVIEVVAFLREWADAIEAEVGLVKKVAERIRPGADT